MFGISDHDLMFALQANKAVEDDAEIDDENSERFILDKVRIVITPMHTCYWDSLKKNFLSLLLELAQYYREKHNTS